MGQINWGALVQSGLTGGASLYNDAWQNAMQEKFRQEDLAMRKQRAEQILRQENADRAILGAAMDPSFLDETPGPMAGTPRLGSALGAPTGGDLLAGDQLGFQGNGGRPDPLDSLPLQTILDGSHEARAVLEDRKAFREGRKKALVLIQSLRERGLLPSVEGKWWHDNIGKFAKFGQDYGPSDIPEVVKAEHTQREEGRKLKRIDDLTIIKNPDGSHTQDEDLAMRLMNAPVEEIDKLHAASMGAGDPPPNITKLDWWQLGPDGRTKYRQDQQQRQALAEGFARHNLDTRDTVFGAGFATSQLAAADKAKALAEKNSPENIQKAADRLMRMYPEMKRDKALAIAEDQAANGRREDLPTLNVSGETRSVKDLASDIDRVSQLIKTSDSGSDQEKQYLDLLNALKPKYAEALKKQYGVEMPTKAKPKYAEALKKQYGIEMPKKEPPEKFATQSDAIRAAISRGMPQAEVGQWMKDNGYSRLPQ